MISLLRRRTHTADEPIEMGFNGFIIDDRVAPLGDDTPWCHRGRAWSTSYIKALIDAVNALA